jgi:hypothetical protein
VRRLALLGGLLIVAAALAGGASASNAITELNDPVWSGYAASGTTSTPATFTHVTGSWIEPSADCSQLKRGTKTTEATWVGLDGFDSNTVEQGGTEANCNGTTESHFAWVEFYPAKFMPLPADDTVQAGDHMTVDVAQDGTTVTVTITDTDRGWSPYVATTTSLAKDQFSSAEWIVESLSEKLTKFSTIHFSNAQASTDTTLFGPADGPWPTTTRLTMVGNNGQKTTPKDQVSDLSGTSFDVQWQHS